MTSLEKLKQFIEGHGLKLWVKEFELHQWEPSYSESNFKEKLLEEIERLQKEEE